MLPLTIPNILTLLRISLIPIFVLFFYLPVDWPYWHQLTAAIFALAALTDWLDGYLARRLQQSSSLGAFLDPVADKLIVVVALMLLVERYATAWLTIPAMVIVGREIVVSALREWMAELGKRRQVAVSHWGKYKTAGQMLAILLMLAQPTTKLGVWHLMAYGLIYLATALTLWSMILYLSAARIALSSPET